MDSVFISLDYLEATLAALPSQIHLPPHLMTAAPRRQQSYLAGRACAQILYQRYGLVWDQLPPIARDLSHPHLPQWPNGFVGSISHSKRLAIACMRPISHCMGIGIDTEETLQSRRMDQLGMRILHPDENWAKTPEELTLIFSFKESLYKAFYPILQRYIGFQEVKVHPFKPIAPHTVSIHWAPEKRLEKELNAHLDPHLYLKSGLGQWLPQPQNRGSVLTRYEIIKRP